MGAEQEIKGQDPGAQPLPLTRWYNGSAAAGLAPGCPFSHRAAAPACFLAKEESLDGVQGTLFKGWPCWGAGRSQRGKAPFEGVEGKPLASYQKNFGITCYTIYKMGFVLC